MLTEHRREAIFDELCSWCAAYAVGQASNAEIDEWGITYALGVAALRASIRSSVTLVWEANLAPLGRGAASRRLRGGLCRADGPSPSAPFSMPQRYITKALNTFDAPDVPIPADVTTKVRGDQHCATVATAAVIAKVTP